MPETVVPSLAFVSRLPFEFIISEKNGFRPNRSCQEHISHLIENWICRQEGHGYIHITCYEKEPGNEASHLCMCILRVPAEGDQHSDETDKNVSPSPA